MAHPKKKKERENNKREWFFTRGSDVQRGKKKPKGNGNKGTAVGVLSFTTKRKKRSIALDSNGDVEANRIRKKDCIWKKQNGYFADWGGGVGGGGGKPGASLLLNNKTWAEKNAQKGEKQNRDEVLLSHGLIKGWDPGNRRPPRLLGEGGGRSRDKPGFKKG